MSKHPSSASTLVKSCQGNSHCNRHLTSNEKRTKTMICHLLKEVTVALLVTSTAIENQQRKTKQRTMLSPCTLRSHSNPSSTSTVVVSSSLLLKRRCHSLPGSSSFLKRMKTMTMVMVWMRINRFRWIAQTLGRLLLKTRCNTIQS